MRYFQEMCVGDIIVFRRKAAVLFRWMLFVLWLLEFQKYAYVNEAYSCQKSMPTLFEASRNAVVMLLSR